MNEDFVSFDLAKKLKEKSFYQPCLAHYNNGKLILQDLYENCGNSAYFFVDAPTIFQVLKWLRGEKKIHIEISPQWQYTVYDMRCNPWIGRSDMQNYDDYTMAAIAGIEYVIDNLI